MPVKPVKIIEIQGQSWMKGISVQKYMPLGGLFRDATNFDPFEESGIQIPTLAGTRRGTSKIDGSSKEIKFFVDWVNTADSNKPYLYGFCNSNEVFVINTLTSFEVTSESNKIAGITTVRGAIRYKDRVLYANDDTVRSNYIPLGASQTTILSGLETADHIMVVAPDRNVYGTNKNYIFRVTNVNGTGNNSAQYLTFEDDIRTRDIISDGKYLIIVADNNNTPANITGNPQGAHRCFVAFWNMKSKDLTQIWEFTDGRIYSAETIEDEVIVFGADNIYTCSLTERIKPLIPLRKNPVIASNNLITPAGTIKVGSGIVIWGMGATFYGYGRPHPYTDKILFKLNTEANANNISAIYHSYNPSNESNLWASSDGNRLYDYAGGTTRNTSSMELTDIDFKKPHEFIYAKIIFRRPLTTGQSITLSIQTANAQRDILNTRTVSFANDGAIASYIFYPEPDATSTQQTHIFEDMTDFILTNNGVEIKRLEIWGRPLVPSQTTGF